MKMKNQPIVIVFLILTVISVQLKCVNLLLEVGNGSLDLVYNWFCRNENKDEDDDFTYESTTDEEVLVQFNCSSAALNLDYTEISSLNVKDEIIIVKNGSSSLSSSRSYLKFTRINNEIKQEFTVNNFQAVRVLYLSNNGIEEIYEAFSGTKFAFRNLEHLDLSSNWLSSIEAYTFSSMLNLKNLILDNNELQSIDEQSFEGLGSLTNLSLARNKLQYIYPDTFKALRKLQVLMLDENKLTSIEAYTFQYSSNLISLRMNANKLNSYSFELNSFYGLANLRELNMLSNPIVELLNPIFEPFANSLQTLRISLKRIKQGDLNHLKNLGTLNFDSSVMINSIQTNSFLGLDKVYDLSIAVNLDELEANAFNGLNNIGDIYLGQKILNHIKSFAFTGMSSLERIQLNGLCVKSIEKAAFYNLSQLRELFIVINSISEIKNGTFELLNNLTDLGLMSSSISVIELGTFDRLPNLRSLRLDFNRILDLDWNLFVGLNLLTYLNLEALNSAKMFANLFNIRRLTFDDESLLKEIKLDKVAISLRNQSTRDICFLRDSVKMSEIKSVAGRPFYQSVHLRTQPDEFDCRLIIYFLKYDLILNMYTYEEINKYFDLCESIDLFTATGSNSSNFTIDC